MVVADGMDVRKFGVGDVWMCKSSCRQLFVSDLKISLDFLVGMAI